MPATVEIGAIQWLVPPPAQTITVAGIPGQGAFGSVTAAVAATQSIALAGIPSSQRIGSTTTALILEGARIRLIAVYQSGTAVAGYQKVYLSYISEKAIMTASYQKHYLGYVLEHEFIAAAKELVEV